MSALPILRRGLARDSLRGTVSLGVQTLNTQHLVTLDLLTTMDISNKEEFIYFMQRACEDQSNDCYIELYNILLRCLFVANIYNTGLCWTPVHLNKVFMGI